MKLEASQVERPLRKLRKMLSDFPVNPRPEDVHDLRTQTRRLEATVAALVLDREKEPRRLIKAITPVRKAAGKVRDMDVLIGDALTLSQSHRVDAVVRLVEHLSRMRLKYARKLCDTVTSRRKEARHRLKQSVKLIQRKMSQETGAMTGEAAPQILMAELRRWPDLDANNLHSFRIRIKELRYMLQLSADANGGLLEKLGDVKDAIGEWHDWVELLKIAKKVLEPDRDWEVLERIEAMGNAKFQFALTAAKEARERYFEGSADRASRPQRLYVVASA